MHTRPLGKSGIQVTDIGFGGWGLGGIYYGPVERNQGVETVRAYLDAGGNHLDSAYSYHASEEIIGEAIRGYDRDKLVVVSKSYACVPDRFDDLHRELGISLRDLGTDYVDVYYLHGPPHDVDEMHRVLDEYDRLREAGKIRAIGVSIKGPDVTDAKTDQALQYIQTGRIDCIQMAYSVLRQKAGIAFRAAADAGVGVAARCVYESGFLSGKYKPGHTFTWPDQRVRYEPDHRDWLLGEIQQLQADEVRPPYASLLELSAAFALANPDVSSLVLGAVRPDQSRANAAMGNLAPMPDEQVQRLQARYADMNDRFNPTGELEHVPSIRS